MAIILNNTLRDFLLVPYNKSGNRVGCGNNIFEGEPVVSQNFARYVNTNNADIEDMPIIVMAFYPGANVPGNFSISVALGVNWSGLSLGVNITPKKSAALASMKLGPHDIGEAYMGSDGLPAFRINNSLIIANDHLRGW